MLYTDKIEIPSERKYTDEGYLIVPAKISRTGIQNYTAAEMGLVDRDPDDIIRVYRPEDEVFNEDSLNSFANKPVTDNHPTVAVDAKNYKDLAVGFSGIKVERNGNFAETVIHVMDADAIAKVESGKNELSNGYSADIEWNGGVTLDGFSYDAIQRNITGNHIAIVKCGRAGPECRLADNLPQEKNGDTMPKITIDGVDFEVSDGAAQAVNKLKQKLKDAEEAMEEKDEELEKAKDEAEEKDEEAKKTEDSYKAKLDDAKSKILSPEELDKLVADRAEFIKTATSLSPNLEWNGKDNLTIKKEVIADAAPDVDLKDKSSDYIDARFDLLVENVKDNPQSTMDKAFKDMSRNTKTNETSMSPSDKARQEMMDRNRNAYKKGDK